MNNEYRMTNYETGTRKLKLDVPDTSPEKTHHISRSTVLISRLTSCVFEVILKASHCRDHHQTNLRYLDHIFYWFDLKSHKLRASVLLCQDIQLPD